MLDDPRRQKLSVIAAEIGDLHEKVRDWAGKQPAKKGKPAPTPNPILFTHCEIGQHVSDFARLHHKTYGHGRDAYEEPSHVLGRERNVTGLRNHSRYAKLPRKMVEAQAKEGDASRKLMTANPKKDMQSDSDIELSVPR